MCRVPASLLDADRAAEHAVLRVSYRGYVVEAVHPQAYSMQTVLLSKLCCE